MSSINGMAAMAKSRSRNNNSQTLLNSLLSKTESGTLTIGVVGLGYVGLPLAVEFARKGIRVHGIDVDAKKVASINRGKNYIQDVNSEWLREGFKAGLLTASTDFSVCAECDAVFICVPTPFTVNKDPDISYIISATEGVAASLKPGQVIILKSTTFPNTTEGYVQPILERSGMKAGRDYFLAFSPERIDPGNQKWHTGNTPIVVGGVTKECTEAACAVNKLIIDKVIPVSSPKVGEMEKLLENIFRSVNIALVNELAQLCDRIGGINIWEVVEAASTKPFGFMPFYPGPGIGGHCILIDPYYLSWAAREYDFVTNFITLAAEVNESMPFYVRAMIEREIARQPIRLEDATVLLLGVAFKRDVDDLRHSPALKVAELLMQDNVRNIEYYDPFISSFVINGRKFTSKKELTPEVLRAADVVVITTDHSAFDYEMIVAESKVVVDTRNACKPVSGEKSNVVLLGDGR